jgi:hypothetical protein
MKKLWDKLFLLYVWGWPSILDVVVVQKLQATSQSFSEMLFVMHLHKYTIRTFRLLRIKHTDVRSATGAQYTQVHALP